MKNISYIELSSIVLVIIVTFYSGINLNILKQDVGINSWIAVIISYVIGFIPLFLNMYISNYKEDLNLFEKNKILFGNYFGQIINIFISLLLLIIGITLLYNITSFITTQFLYRTPMIISASILIILVIYCTTKEINVISHISLILMIINFIIFFISNISLIGDVKIDNLLPILKLNNVKILPSAIKIACINTLPIISILIIPKDKITNKNKYNKWLIIAYIIGCIMSFIMVAGTISVLGIYLTKTFEFSEYMVLKKVKLFGFLERVENIISMQWITETYIYLTIIIYTISKIIPAKNKKVFNFINIIIGIFLVISSKYLFKNTTIFNTYVKSSFIYIVSLFIIIYILISFKVLLNNLKNRQSKKIQAS